MDSLPRQTWVLLLVVAVLVQSLAIGSHMPMATDAMMGSNVEQLTEMADCHSKKSTAANAVQGNTDPVSCCDGDCSMNECQPQGAVIPLIASLSFEHQSSSYRAATMATPTKRNTSLFRPPVFS